MTKSSKARKGSLTIQAIMLSPFYILLVLIIFNSILTYVRKNVTNDVGNKVMRSAVVCDNYETACKAIIAASNSTTVKLSNFNPDSTDPAKQTVASYTEGPMARIFIAGASTAVAEAPISGATASQINKMNTNWKIGNILVLRFINVSSKLNSEDVTRIFNLNFYDKSLKVIDPNPKTLVRATIENEV